jgi:AmpE protein
MAFLVVLSSALIERFFDWSHLRNWHWAHLGMNSLATRVAISSPPLLLASWVIPVLAIAILADIFTHSIFYGFISIFFNIFLLLYCLGPQNLWAEESTSVISAVGGARVQVETFFVRSNVRLFAPIFYYLLFGVVGAVGYRLVAEIAKTTDNTNPATVHAYTLQGWLDWAPIRIATLLFALGGHFMDVFSAWADGVLEGAEANEKLLITCGFKALSIPADVLVIDENAAHMQAVHLIDRVLIISLVMIALTVISL